MISFSFATIPIRFSCDFRRREAELSEDIDSARKLVKKLQVENTDLVKREKHKVELLVAGQVILS